MRCLASHLLGLYNSLSEALGHRMYEASALEEDSLIAALELTVFTGFQKGGISKSLLEAIGRMQVVRGIQKKSHLTPNPCHLNPNTLSSWCSSCPCAPVVPPTVGTLQSRPNRHPIDMIIVQRVLQSDLCSKGERQRAGHLFGPILMRSPNPHFLPRLCSHIDFSPTWGPREGTGDAARVFDVAIPPNLVPPRRQGSGRHF